MAFKPVFKEVTLSDGSKATVRNLNGADEMMALQILGKELKQDEPLAGMMLLSNMQFVLSIVMLGNEAVKNPRTYREALEFLGTFSVSDLNKLRQAYQELNGESAEDFFEKSNS